MISKASCLLNRNDKSGIYPTPIVIFQRSRRFHISFPLYKIYHIFNINPIGTTHYFWFFCALVSTHFNNCELKNNQGEFYIVRTLLKYLQFLNFPQKALIA